MGVLNMLKANIIMIVGDNIKNNAGECVQKELIAAVKNIITPEDKLIPPWVSAWFSVTMNDGIYNFQLETTSGKEEYPRIRNMDYSSLKPNCFIALFDRNDRRSFERINNVYLPEIKSTRPGTPIIMLGISNNFSSYTSKQVEKPVSIEEAQRVANANKLPYFECDLKNPQEIAEVWYVAIRSAFGPKERALWDSARALHRKSLVDMLTSLQALRTEQQPVSYFSLLPPELVKEISETTVSQKILETKRIYLIAVGMFSIKNPPKVELNTSHEQPDARNDNNDSGNNNTPLNCTII